MIVQNINKNAANFQKKVYDIKNGSMKGLVTMLTKIEFKLTSSSELSFQMSSLFHGALMELLPVEYADYLHTSQLHPYTQHLERRDGEWYWIVSCLNDEANSIIIKKTLQETKMIELKKHHINVFLEPVNIKSITEKEMMGRFYKEDSAKYIQIHFVSPTAFKQKGQYVFYPNIRCIFQSLMSKYDAAVGENQMLDEETLKQLSDHAMITRYDLKSVSFSLEGVRIPAFVGKITIKMRGTQTMANFANMLIQFGEFSGVGIKTTLGMGAIKIIDVRSKKC